MIALKRGGVAANACTYHKRNRALERKPPYSNRKEPFLMAHQHSFSQDAEPLGLLTGEQRMSRRTILRRLAGLTLAGGSITSFVTSCCLHPNPSPASQTSTGSPTDPPPISQTSTSSSLRTALYTYRGHSADVMGVAWSPDGKRLASASNDGTVQVWDAANGGHVYTYRGHADRVNAVAWPPDGKGLASGSNDVPVQVCDAADGGDVYTYRGHADAVWGVAWSPDGRRIVSGSGNIDNGGGDTTAQVWDAANGGHALIYRGHSDPVWTVAWCRMAPALPRGARIGQYRCGERSDGERWHIDFG